MSARRSFYQPVLVRVFCDFTIVEAWLPFMTCRICILRTFLPGWSFLFMIHADCGAIAVIASTTYMTSTVVELFDEYPAPFSPEMVPLTLIMTPTSILNDIILSVKTEKLAVEGNRFWSRSIVATILFLFLTWWLSNSVPVPFSRHTITKQIQDPIFNTYRPQLLCSKIRFTLHSSISVTSSWLHALKSSQTSS